MAATVSEPAEHRGAGTRCPGPDEEPEKTAPTTDATDEESGASVPAQPLQRWNQSVMNMFRFFTTLYTFGMMGMTDGALGVRAFLCPGEATLKTRSRWSSSGGGGRCGGRRSLCFC